MEFAKHSMGILVAPLPLSFGGLQQAAEDALAQGKVLVASGELTTDQTLVLRGNFDLGTLTYRYTGTGTAVRIGDPNADVRATVGTAPRTRFANKGPSGTGWDSTSCGVELVNLIGANVTIPHVVNFCDGLRLAAEGTGTVYNNVYLGRVENKKRNIVLTTGEAGSWTGENKFYGGQVSHLNGEPGAGTRQIIMTGRPGAGDISRPTGNLFIGTSLETRIAERILDVESGRANFWLGCRWEDARWSERPAILWGPNAIHNMVIGGYDADRLSEERATGQSMNCVIAPGQWFFPGENQVGTGRGGGAVFNNKTSTLGPAWSVAGAAWSGEDIATNYAVQTSENYIRAKRTTDAFPRIEVHNQNGRVFVGNGTATPTHGIAHSVLGLQLAGDRVHVQGDNTVDFGTSSNGRVRTMYVGTSVLFGDGGTLPSATSSRRGETRIVRGAAGAPDGVFVCIKNAADSYEWKQLA